MARRDRLQKTNAMRELERAGIPFAVMEYAADDGSPSSGYGVHVAELLGEEEPRSIRERLRRTEKQELPQRKKNKDRGWER